MEIKTLLKAVIKNSIREFRVFVNYIKKLKKYNYSPDKYNIRFLGHKKSIYYNAIAEKRIFVFWTGDNEMSDNRKKGLQSIQEKVGVPVILVTNKNLTDYILVEYPIHKSYPYLSDVYKSDYLRCYFMHHHGGGYSDVKIQEKNWNKCFEKLNSDNLKIAVGYPEISKKDIGYTVDFFEQDAVKSLNMDLKKNYFRMIGNGSYIFKPNTEFTKDWINELHLRLDVKYEELKSNPGNVFGNNLGYSLPWTSVLGQIFHPLCLKYNNNLILDNTVKPNFKYSHR